MDQNKIKIQKLVDKSNIEDVEDGLFSRHCFKITSDVLDIIAHILFALGGLFAFADATWKLTFLSYVSGSCTAVGFAIKGFGQYALGESKERTLEVNKILNNLKIGQIVDITGLSTINNNNDI